MIYISKQFCVDLPYGQAFFLMMCSLLEFFFHAASIIKTYHITVNMSQVASDLKQPKCTIWKQRIVVLMWCNKERCCCGSRLEHAEQLGQVLNTERQQST